jgi:hypothetical protein
VNGAFSKTNGDQKAIQAALAKGYWALFKKPSGLGYFHFRWPKLKEKF